MNIETRKFQLNKLKEIANNKEDSSIAFYYKCHTKDFMNKVKSLIKEEIDNQIKQIEC
jgi:hypothetical protein